MPLYEKRKGDVNNFVKKIKKGGKGGAEMNFLQLAVSFVAISEFGKNISKIVKNFFECVEISKRIKSEVILQSTTYGEDNMPKFNVSTSWFILELQQQIKNNSMTPNCKPIVLLSNSLSSDNNCLYAVNSIQNILIDTFNDKKESINDLLSKYISDNVVIIDTDIKKRKSSILFYMLNIIPSNDNKCYVLKFEIDYNERKHSAYSQFALIMSHVIMEMVIIFKKYRNPIHRYIDRLELEARILNNMGYHEVEIMKVSDGYGIELSLVRADGSILSFNEINQHNLAPLKAIIELPHNYPKEKPLVLLKFDDSYTEVKLEIDWHANYTIGHIIKAIEVEVAEERNC